MSSAIPVSRREFARLAVAGTGTAILGCSNGVFSPDREVVLTLSGTGRLLDGSGKVLAARELAPGVAAGLVKDPITRPASLSSGVGALHIPRPSLIAFRASPARQPAISRRSDRASDGTVIETTFETLGQGIPSRRTVRVPAQGIELVDTHGFHELRALALLERRRIEVRKDGKLVADLSIEASGAVRLALSPRQIPGTIGRVLLPAPLHAQSDCGINLVLHFLSATLAVIAALGSCAMGIWCLFGLIGTLIDWAEAISEMEACQQT